MWSNDLQQTLLHNVFLWFLCTPDGLRFYFLFYFIVIQEINPTIILLEHNADDILSLVQSIDSKWDAYY